MTSTVPTTSMSRVPTAAPLASPTGPSASVPASSVWPTASAEPFIHYKCRFCEKTFMRSSNARRHELFNCTKNLCCMSYLCDRCGHSGSWGHIKVVYIQYGGWVMPTKMVASSNGNRESRGNKGNLEEGKNGKMAAGSVHQRSLVVRENHLEKLSAGIESTTLRMRGKHVPHDHTHARARARTLLPTTCVNRRVCKHYSTTRQIQGKTAETRQLPIENSYHLHRSQTGERNKCRAIARRPATSRNCATRRTGAGAQARDTTRQSPQGSYDSWELLPYPLPTPPRNGSDPPAEPPAIFYSRGFGHLYPPCGFSLASNSDYIINSAATENETALACFYNPPLVTPGCLAN
ncbi:hypothetical protein PR048_027919 [Dryococelus australis]|uniref:C2H2-type domain-containing protein n=1 Tax=Dryococelus australis TaxID=614101 RepID=A0ABQ9GHV0_9NEOP|nr:hypothetical protein PR048_027919 [Dryococelus australis]